VSGLRRVADVLGTCHELREQRCLRRDGLVTGLFDPPGSLKEVAPRLDLLELGMIVATRAILGVGIALLLADRFTRDERRTIGETLTVVGFVATIPAISAVCGNVEKKRTLTPSENPAERRAS
jgi:hypothetical protein